MAAQAETNCEKESPLIDELLPGDRSRAEKALAALCASLRKGGKEHLPALGEYLQISPLCAELFDLWEGGHDGGESARLNGLVLEVFAAVLAGRFERTAVTARTRAGVAGRILAERFQLLIRTLSSDRDHYLRVTLRVLAGIGSQSVALAAQLHRSFNFDNENLHRLPGRRAWGKSKQEGHEDVRGCYISFVLSFLRWRDASLTSAIIGIRGFIGPVISGLKDDEPHQAVTFLKHLEDNILRPRQIPRYSKLMLFNSFGLRHLCTLLASEHQEVVASVKQLLIDICTNSFLFRTQQHQLLLDMCLDMKPLMEPQQELVSAVLRAHPDLQILYCSKLVLSIQPRLSEQWFLNIRFLIALLGMDIDRIHGAVDHALAQREDAAPQLRAVLTIQAIVPPSAQRSLLTQAFLHQDYRIVLAGLRLLSTLLLRIERALAIPGTNRESPSAVSEVSQQLLRHLPDLSTLLLIWQKLFKLDGEKESQEEQSKTFKKSKKNSKEQHDGTSEVAVDSKTDHELNNINTARAAQLLGVQEDDFQPYAIFIEWCRTTRLYCTILPRSLMDVKFDWSKLFAPVAASVVKCGDPDALPERTFTCIQQCALCVDAAMRSSGRSESIQLSKSQLSWIEGLLQVRTCTALQQSANKSMVAEVMSTCDSVLRRCLRPYAAFGFEEDSEISVWATQLGKLPTCVPFFCRTLQAVASKPGSMAGYFQDAINDIKSAEPCRDKKEHDFGIEKISLFLFAAIRQLTLRDSYALPPAADCHGLNPPAFRSQCARLVKNVACQICTTFPQMGYHVALLAEHLGAWGQEGDDTDTSSTSAEEIRQTLIARVVRSRPVKRASEGFPTQSLKRQKVEANGFEEDGGAVQNKKQVAKTLTAILSDDGRNSAVVMDDNDPIAMCALRHRITAAVQRGSARVHCGAYVLVDGMAACFQLPDSWRLLCWYLLLLIELAPAIACVESPILDFVLSHSIWGQFAQVVALGTAGQDCSLCMILVTRFFCQLVTLGSQPPKLAPRIPVDAIRHLCRLLLLPLWKSSSLSQHLEMNDIFPAKLIRDDDDTSWMRDPLRVAASSTVTVCVLCNMLNELVSDESLSVQNDASLAIAQALLAGDVSLASTHLPTRKRAQLLKHLVVAVLAGRSSSEQWAPAAVLKRALVSDQAAALEFLVRAKLKHIWPHAGKKGEVFSSELFLILERACRVNVALRKELISRLDWSTCDPSTTLLFVCTLAPLERSIPCLRDDVVAGLHPGQLQPLPPCQHLLRLLELYPRASALRQLLQRGAMEGLQGDEVERHILALRLEAQLGRTPLLENMFVNFVGAVRKRTNGNSLDLRTEAHHVCSVMQTLQPLSERVLDNFRFYCDGLVEAAEASSVLFSGILACVGSAKPHQWQLELVSRLLRTRVDGMLPAWLLCHAIRWWQHLDPKSETIKQFVTDVRRSYNASLSSADRRRRQLLVSHAAQNVSVAIGVAQSLTTVSGGDMDFRQWCGSLPPWGEASAWNWVLDAQRVQKTIDRFWYDRPFVEGIPWAHQEQTSDSQAFPDHSASNIDAHGAYDIGYVVPFVAGQLRALWAEHGEENAESRHYIGPVLNSVMSGGVLELLLMSCACSDGSIRGAAYESLSILLALANHWKDVMLEEDQSSAGKTKVRNPFRELPNFVWLLKSVRNTVEPPEHEGDIPLALPALMASFMCACVPVLLKPQHFLYMKIGLFLMGNVTAELLDVPLFYKALLFDEAESSHEARLWMFRVIRRALRSHREYADNYTEDSAGHGYIVTDILASMEEEGDDDVVDGGECDELQGGAAKKQARQIEGGVDDHATRAALERRHVVPWLLSFADSQELAGFGLWIEAVACLEAALVYAPLAAPAIIGGAARRFAVADWIAAQALRRWPGAGGGRQRVEALGALTRLLHGILSKGNAAAHRASLSEQLAIGGAFDALVRGWAAAAADDSGGDREVRPPFARLWVSMLGLAALAKRSSRSQGGRCSNPTANAVAAQLGSLLHRLGELAVRLDGSETAAAAERAPTAALARLAWEVASTKSPPHVQVLAVLEVCPLTVVGHRLFVHLLSQGARNCQSLEKVPASGNDSLATSPMESLRELLPKTEASVLRFVTGLLTALRAIDSTSLQTAFSDGLKNSAASAIRLLAVLPYRPHTAWRVYLVTSAALLLLHPGSTSLDAKRLAELAGDLPGPETIALDIHVSQPTTAAEEKEENHRLVQSSALLAEVLSKCDDS